MWINLGAIAVELLSILITCVAHIAILLVATTALSLAWTAIKWVYKKVRILAKCKKNDQEK